VVGVLVRRSIGPKACDEGLTNAKQTGVQGEASGVP